MAKVVFRIQIFLIFGSRCNHYFLDIQLEIYRLPNFNMLFQLVLTKISKVNCFSVYQKLITWPTNAKGLIKSAHVVPFVGGGDGEGGGYLGQFSVGICHSALWTTTPAIIFNCVANYRPHSSHFWGIMWFLWFQLSDLCLIKPQLGHRKMN